MNYLSYVKKAYKVIPGKYKSKTLLYIVLSFLNLILELFSIALLIPLIIVIIDKEALHSLRSVTSLNLDFTTPGFLMGSVALIIILFIIKNIFSIRILKFQTTQGFQIASALSLFFVQDYINKDFIEFSKQDKAGAVRNIAEIPNKYVSYVLLALNTISAELLLLAFIFAAGLIIDPFVTIFLLFILGLSALIIHTIGKKKIRQINQRLPAIYSSNMANLLNILNGFFEIKATRKEAYFLDRFEKSNVSLNAAYSKLHAYNLVTPKQTEVMIIIILGSILLFYNYIFEASQSYILYISFLASAAIKVVPSINKIIINFLNFKSHLFTIDLIAGIKDIYPAVLQTETKPLTFNTSLRLENVHFSYDDKPLFKGLNMSVQKGEISAVIGNSGVGKSSLLYIIGQFLAPQKGSVIIDDMCITRKNKDAFLGLLSYVPQQPLIMEGTILENLTLGGAIKHNLVDVKQYLKDFDLQDRLSNLPEKLNTFIGNDGHQLSGGQLQRLALIRALLAKPRILILDEGTNQLEKQLELKVLKRLQETAKKDNLTIILVSHHIRNIASISDKIYELTRGELKLLKNKPGHSA